MPRQAQRNMSSLSTKPSRACHSRENPIVGRPAQGGPLIQDATIRLLQGNLDQGHADIVSWTQGENNPAMDWVGVGMVGSERATLQNTPGQRLRRAPYLSQLICGT
jgi:hypothetical protein